MIALAKNFVFNWGGGGGGGGKGATILTWDKTFKYHFCLRHAFFVQKILTFPEIGTSVPASMCKLIIL